jgi:hypothetical protein
MKRKPTVILLCLLGLGLMPSSALGNARDIASTRAYVIANYTLVRTAHTDLPSAEARIAALNTTLGQQCPQVAANSPQNGQSQQLSNEVAGALWSIVYHTDVGAVNAFVNAVTPLHWTNHKLTRIARHYAESLRQLSDLPMPEVCADVRSWTSSGFKTVPASTIQFDKRLEAIGASTIPQRLLARYERPSIRAIASRADKLEAQLNDAETNVGFNDWNTLLETLGLSQ